MQMQMQMQMQMHIAHCTTQKCTMVTHKHTTHNAKHLRKNAEANNKAPRQCTMHRGLQLTLEATPTRWLNPAADKP